MATIQKLPVDVRSYLRSGVTVTSVTQCVEELLLNSLDAGATCVAVRVDLDCFKIQVVDNGSGIAQDQLKLLADRYATSKCHSVTDLENLSYFGYRGEALASIRESCSVLEITTKTKESSKTYSKLFQDGRPLDVIESTIPRPSLGTTVTIHDLFSNFPVRRKSTNTSLELERIRQRIEALALFRPSVSISLRNDSTSVVLVQTHKYSNSLLTFKHLFGADKANILSEINGSKSYFTVEGYIGKEGHSKKELQFIYVNGRLVLKTKIHKLVNKMLTNSAIFKRKYSTRDSTPNVESKSVFVKSPGRQIERYPVFVVNIKCPLTKYDITFDPSKTLIEFTDWDSLLELTKEILNDFLKKENLVCQEETLSESNHGNIEKISNENKGQNSIEKKTLSNIISPSNLRGTLFSKPAKRKSAELDQYKTPVSISIEEWKAENNNRKVVLNETENSSSLNSSDATFNVQNQSDSTMGESSENANDSQLNDQRKISDNKETVDSSSNQSGLQTQQSVNTVMLNTVRMSNENRQVINEKGDDNPCKRVLELQKLQNRAVNEIGHDNGSYQISETLGRAYLVPTSPSEANTAAVSVSSKSSLSEFRKRIGKSVTDMSHTVSVDEKLKENFEDKHVHKIAQEMKYTSSLQKFKKQFLNHEQNTINSGTEISHENQTNPKPDRLENQIFLRKQANMLEKSGISVTDSRMNNDYSSDQLNNFQNTETDRNYPCQVFHSLTYGNDKSEPRYDTTDCSSADKVRNKTTFDGIRDKCCSSVATGRKRSYPGIETETIAYKLARLSKQKTATISVTSTCGPTRSPLHAEISCGDNTVVTVVSENKGPLTHRNFPPPCATVTSDSMNIDFQFNPVLDTDTGTSECNHNIPEFSDFTNICGINQVENNLTSNPYEDRQCMPLNSDFHTDAVKSGHLIENSLLEIATGNAEIHEQNNVNNSYDTFKFTAEKVTEKPLNTANYSFKQVNYLYRSGNKNCMTNNINFEQNIDLEDQPLKTPTKGNGLQHTKDNGMEGQDKIISTVDSEPFEFSTQGFSPCMNGSETGLSQKMTDVSISEQQVIDAEKFTPSIVMSPRSMGFSPCMSVSPASLPDNESVDSQGFTALSEDQHEMFTTRELKNNDDGDLFPTVETETVTVTKLSSANDADKEYLSINGPVEPCKNKDNSKSISISESENKSEKISDTEHDTAEQSERNQQSEDDACTIEQFEKQGKTKAVLNMESESNSEDILFTNKTVRISQMLLTASQHKATQSSPKDSTQCSSDIHFTDIFPPSESERMGKTSEVENSGSQENETVKGKSQYENNSDVKEAKEYITFSEVAGSADKHTEAVTDTTDTDANDDTLLQPTPDNSGLFSSWDCSCASGVLITNVVQEHDTTDKNSKNTEQMSELEKSVVDCSKTGKIFDETISGKEARGNGKESAKAVLHNEELGKKEKSSSANTNLEKEHPEEEVKGYTEQRKWIQMKDPKSGKKIYVHSLLGTTVTENQWKASHGDEPRTDDTGTSASNVSKITKGKTELPALTPNRTERLHNLMADYIATGGTTTTDNDDDEEDAFIKWRDTHTPDPSCQGPSSVEELFAEWSNPVFESTDKDVINTEVSALPKSTVKAYRALHCCKFTKEMLNTVKVIGQVDKKFIACLMKTDPAKSTRPDMLAVIDQHAAHERIRLELLTEESFTECDVESGVLEVYKVDPPKCLELTGDEVRIMMSYEKEFNRIGIRFHCEPQSRTKILIQTIPACIMEKDVNYVKSTRENIAWNIVQALIKKHVELLVSTGGAGKKLPTVLHKALCSQACHGAIKFGDSLTLRECEALIRDLSGCDLPFQCAHGRPSVMPVLQLEQLRTKLPQEKQRRPQLYKLSNAIQRVQSAKP